METPYQQLAQIYYDLGIRVVLRPYDEVLSVKWENDLTCRVVLARHRITERATADLLTSREVVMLTCTSGEKFPKETMRIPDPDFVPRRATKWGYKTEAERRAKSLWEASCGRPGTSRFGAPIQAERERRYFS